MPGTALSITNNSSKQSYGSYFCKQIGTWTIYIVLETAKCHEGKVKSLIRLEPVSGLDRGDTGNFSKDWRIWKSVVDARKNGEVGLTRRR